MIIWIILTAQRCFYTSSGIWGLTILRSDLMILHVIYGVSDISCFSDLPELFARNQVPDASWSTGCANTQQLFDICSCDFAVRSGILQNLLRCIIDGLSGFWIRFYCCCRSGFYSFFYFGSAVYVRKDDFKAVVRCGDRRLFSLPFVSPQYFFEAGTVRFDVFISSYCLISNHISSKESIHLTR